MLVRGTNFIALSLYAAEQPLRADAGAPELFDLICIIAVR